jgi:hypothetical protein
MTCEDRGLRARRTWGDFNEEIDEKVEQRAMSSSRGGVWGDEGVDASEPTAGWQGKCIFDSHRGSDRQPTKSTARRWFDDKSMETSDKTSDLGEMGAV